MRNTFPLAALVSVALCGVVSAASEYQTDLDKALETAKAEQKLVFVFYGREACSICQTTKAMIKSNDLRVSPSKYVMVDVNCDDPKAGGDFNKRYKEQKFGKTLPFIVVADANGDALASGSGPKNAREWDKILKGAQKKAPAPAGATAAGAKDANWPFKSAPTPKP